VAGAWVRACVAVWASAGRGLWADAVEPQAVRAPIPTAATVSEAIRALSRMKPALFLSSGESLSAAADVNRIRPGPPRFGKTGRTCWPARKHPAGQTTWR